LVAFDICEGDEEGRTYGGTSIGLQLKMEAYVTYRRYRTSPRSNPLTLASLR
jgi:hypothetical protein